MASVGDKVPSATLRYLSPEGPKGMTTEELFAPGKKVEDFAHWSEAGGMKGPPPAEALGGVTLLDKGARGSFSADLTPGEYGFICYFPDTKDGKPHLAHGMMKTFTVS